MMSITKFLRTQLLAGLILSSVFSGTIQAQVKPGSEAGSKVTVEGKEYYLHVVKQGEGFFALSRQYNVTRQEILKANPGLTDGLKRGEVIKIPVIKGRNTTAREIEKEGDFILHTVEPGQTVYFISRKYDVSIQSIYDNNPGSKDKLVSGSILKIPVKDAETSSRANAPAGDEPFVHHTVKPGETLYALSRQFDVTVQEIVDLNPALKSGILSSGSVVRLPRQNQEVKSSGMSSSQSALDNEDFLYHEIKAGQTLFWVSRHYNVQVDDIKKANPEIETNNLNPGYKLRVPRRPDEPADAVTISQQDDKKLFRIHRVKRRETLFAISREYNVDMETLRKVNPEVDFSNLRKGTNLKIPREAWFALNATASQTEESAEISFDAFRDADRYSPADSMCQNVEELGKTTPVKVALLMPFAVEESRKANEIVTIENGDSIVSIRPDKIIANRSKVFVEFYEGALLALDSLKKQGFHVDLSVYDITHNGAALQRVLRSPRLKNADMIIGPARSEALAEVSAFAMEHKIKLIYPLSNTNPELMNNPYVFQINTPDSLMFKEMSDEIISQASGHNLLVILPADADPYADAFMKRFRSKVYFHEFARDRNIRYREYTLSGADENLNNLRALIDRNGKNFVVIPTNNEATISKAIPVLAGVKEKTRADISLFGMSEWPRAQSIDPEDMFALKAQVFSFFALDYSIPATNRFINKYRSWYHTEPHAVSPLFQSSSSSSGFSRYGIWGHDVTYYFVYAMATRGRNFEYCPEPLEVRPIQFNFSLSRVSNWGGFYNRGLFLLKFGDNYQVSRVPLLLFEPMVPANPILPSDI